MIKRTISTIVLWLAVGGLLVFLGAPAAVILLIILAATTQHELYQMLEKMGYRPFRKTGITVGGIFLAITYLFPDMTIAGPDGAAIAFVAIGIAVVVLKSPDRTSAILSTAAGFAYAPFLLHYFIRILQLPHVESTGLAIAFWVVVLVKFTDMGGYLAGSFFGRHKLAPSLSPGKTWEGFVGGLILSAVGSAIYVWFFYRLEGFPAELTPMIAAIVAIPIAAVSVASDLLESAFKRGANIKDSGRTIPGIGGSFDLTDSLILSVPAAYAILLFILASTGA